MPNPITITLGRLVQAAAKLRGGGTALPGLVVEKFEPDFAAKVLGQLPLGVVLVSGTNGKTTTVKVVTELLRAAGLRVFTNNTGSNFMRGIISSLLREVDLSGRLRADIAVLELDEAHAVNFVLAIKPRYTLLLNVMHDQIDRFSEIGYTAELLAAVARNTTGIVILNREDPLLAELPVKEGLAAEVRWFGLVPELRDVFAEDEACLGGGLNSSPVDRGTDRLSTPELTAVLADFADNTARIEIDDQDYYVELALKGIYNAYNATAALALVHAVTPETPIDVLTNALAQVHSAFGRGETVVIDGMPVELILVKNPGGFRLALRSFSAGDAVTMITISDEYGDGRDVSWLYDVDFSSLCVSGVAMVSGSRAFDMALRLEYDEVPLQNADPNLSAALDDFLAKDQDKLHRIYCSYTTMLALRKLLSTKTEMEQIL